MKPIVLLSGAVGAGKTTVGRELVALSPSPVAYIEGDQFWSFLAKPEPTEIPEKRFKMTMTAMMAAALPYALHGYEAIVDFSIPPWFLPTAVRMAGSRDVPLDYVVVLPSVETCAARAAGRDEGKILDYEPYRELYGLFSGMEPHTVRDDVSEARTVAEEIRIGLDTGRFRLRDP